MILVTAFDAFGGMPVNASEMLLRALPEDPSIARAVLATAYRPAAVEIVRLIETVRPKAVISFGTAPGFCFRLEKVACNRDTTADPDNAGEIRFNQIIDPAGPPIYEATLPHDRIAANLSASGVPHAFSDDAGGFVCNHTFYVARHYLQQGGLAIPCGFVHVPAVADAQNFAMLLKGMDPSWRR